MSLPLVVSFGGGVNSAAMLVGMDERKIRPDLILFADTGGEKPETYEFMHGFDNWLWCRDFPRIVVVRANSVDPTLEAACLKTHSLPSIAYGFRTCSQRWKLQPQEKYVRDWLKEHGKGAEYVRAVGIDAGEPQRAKDYPGTWYPLIEWGWDRERCIKALNDHGIYPPIKSACFFCPSSKKSEVLWLKRTHPDLFERAVEMERNAAATNEMVKGLGRHWSWEALAEADEAQYKLWTDAPEIPCMCFDGEAA